MFSHVYICCILQGFEPIQQLAGRRLLEYTHPQWARSRRLRKSAAWDPGRCCTTSLPRQLCPGLWRNIEQIEMKPSGISQVSWSSPTSGILQSPVHVASFEVVQVRVENHTAIDLLPVTPQKDTSLDRDLIKINQSIMANCCRVTKHHRWICWFPLDGCSLIISDSEVPMK